jgi:hypothetical protein
MTEDEQQRKFLRIKREHKLSDTMVLALCSAKMPGGGLVCTRWDTCKALVQRELADYYSEIYLHGLSARGEEVRLDLLDVGEISPRGVYRVKCDGEGAS